MVKMTDIISCPATLYTMGDSKGQLQRAMAVNSPKEVLGPADLSKRKYLLKAWRVYSTPINLPLPILFFFLPFL
jgi:hypothetical protein